MQEFLKFVKYFSVLNTHESLEFTIFDFCFQTNTQSEFWFTDISSPKAC